MGDLWNKTKAWASENRVITGALGGAAAGLAIPIVGPIFGAATGASIGYLSSKEEEKKKVKTVYGLLGKR